MKNLAVYSVSELENAIKDFFKTEIRYATIYQTPEYLISFIKKLETDLIDKLIEVK